MSNEYYFFGTRTTSIRTVSKIFCRVMMLLNQIHDSARVSHGGHAGIQGFFSSPMSCFLGTFVPLTKYSAVY